MILSSYFRRGRGGPNSTPSVVIFDIFIESSFYSTNYFNISYDYSGSGFISTHIR